MTIEQYNRATEILNEKKSLEEHMCQLRMSVNFAYNTKEYEEVCNRLFVLGQEFAAL